MSHDRRIAVALAIVALLVAGCAATRAAGRGYEIHTRDLSCEEANRYTQQALADMGLSLTDFRKAEPGAPGYAKAARGSNEGGALKGSVDIACDAGGVHLIPDQSGVLDSQQFERGFFLSLTGRADLVVEREGRDATGVLHKRTTSSAATSGAPAAATAPHVSDSGALAAGAAVGAVTAQNGDVGADSPFAENTAGGVEVQVELVRGFATVLDFEANVSAVGVLPVKITVANKTSRAYDFNPRDVVLRKDGTADKTEPMTASKAVEKLKSGKVEDSAKDEEQQPPTPGTVAGAPVKGLGDVDAGSRLLAEREIKKARLEPGQSVSGYVYFPDGDYDRARVNVTDVATGETEGFVVEF
jgi:hypothetical protein